jgi:UDP-N-acetylmuramate dehydrogenase
MCMSETNNLTDIRSLRVKGSLKGALRGRVCMNESMKKHTSWRAGGEVERVYIPADLADLSQFLLSMPQGEPVHMVGLGSNLLVRDGGLRGTVILLHAQLNDLRLEQHNEEGGLIYVDAGVACAKVARFAALSKLAGAEFLAGIPGTVGGALAMNAGCYGTETWEIVERVRTLNRSGHLHDRHSKDYRISYRQVSLKSDIRISTDSSSEEWFVGVWFRLKKGDEATSRRKIKELLSRRINSQPLSLPNAGSVFRNPPGDHAARLIESCGLKGFSIGGAMVSTKHANFIVNTGNAMAEDIEAVISEVSKAVKEKTGVTLIQEVRIIGEAK